MKHRLLLTAFASLCAVVLAGCGCAQSTPGYYHNQGEAFHTYYSIKYRSDRAMDQEIAEALQKLNNVANPFEKGTLLYRLNNNETTLTDSTFRLLFSRAMEVSRMTQGKYDITVGPLVNIWGFGFEPSPWKEGKVPQSAIDSIRQFVGFDKVTLRGDTLVKADPRIRLDMASIAKGYSSDLVADALCQKGVSDYLVEIGGEVAFSGINPDGEAWRVGVSKPVFDTLGISNQMACILHLTGKGGMATSGNYHNYKVRADGSRYAHTIDPTAGYPIESDVLSATIIAPNCALADALATASMVLGSSEALRLCEQQQGVECLLLVSDRQEPEGFRMVKTSGMDAYIKEVEANNDTK